ncbi:NADH dehydrogenase [compost metagenome]
MGYKLGQALNDYGVNVLHGVKVVQEKEGLVILSNTQTIPTGLCVWTLGLLPNPLLQDIGLPLTPDGRVVVDPSYRVQGMTGVYSIGDCARIIDPDSGKEDQMTCKEGTAQAARLGGVVLADLNGRPAPAHQGYRDLYCFGLGADRGMVWTRQWGLDILVIGRLGWKIRKLSWDFASLVK